jgi:hypothetical protein
MKRPIFRVWILVAWIILTLTSSFAEAVVCENGQIKTAPFYVGTEELVKCDDFLFGAYFLYSPDGTLKARVNYGGRRISYPLDEGAAAQREAQPQEI